MSRIKYLKVNRLKIPEHTTGEVLSYGIGWNKGFRNGIAAATTGIIGGIILAGAIVWILFRNGAPG